MLLKFDTLLLSCMANLRKEYTVSAHNIEIGCICMYICMGWLVRERCVYDSVLIYMNTLFSVCACFVCVCVLYVRAFKHQCSTLVEARAPTRKLYEFTQASTKVYLYTSYEVFHSIKCPVGLFLYEVKCVVCIVHSSSTWCKVHVVMRCVLWSGSTSLGFVHDREAGTLS